MRHTVASLMGAVLLTALTLIPSSSTSPPARAGYVLDSGLEIEVVRTGQPTFVAYFTVNRWGQWVYTGDTGWIYASQYDVTVANWPYGSTPLVLAAYRGDPWVGSPSLRMLGYTMVSGGRIVSR